MMKYYVASKIMLYEEILMRWGNFNDMWKKMQKLYEYDLSYENKGCKH